MEKNIETNEQVVERFVGMVIKKHPDNIYLHKSVRRLVNKIKFTDNCWLWQGKIEKNGYGRIWIDGKSVLSHRFSYATFIGDIPENYTIDHRCHNDNTDTCSGGWSCIHRRCFNPEHLEANINSNLSRENGFEAHIRFIDRKEDGKGGRFEYVAEIVPYKEVRRERWKEVTDHFLHSLPKTIRNFLITNDCRDLAKNER